MLHRRSLALATVFLLSACTDDPGATPILVCAGTTPTNHGEGTYYAATGAGNCGFPATPSDLMVAAMNHTDYAGSAACGACVAIDGPAGSVTVRIVDQCPECAQGDIDLSREAFQLIAPLSAGRVPIDWRYVPCTVTSGIVYHFKNGSNPSWTAVQIRNHALPVATFEYLGQDGVFHDVPRVDYNYFIADHGMGAGPFTFRVTDVEGNVIEDSGIPLLDDDNYPSSSQFGMCK